jgi:hypothetical protein
MVVSRVNARFRVRKSSVINVPISVLNTWNLNSVMHMLVRFRNVSKLVLKIVPVLLKIVLK